MKVLNTARRALSSAAIDTLESRRMFSVAYNVTDLAPDTAGGVHHTGYAYGISDDGKNIAGEYDGHAAIWINGVRKDLGFSGYANDINNSGTAVGMDTSSGERGFIWKNNTKTILTLSGNTTGGASAVNNSDTVAGWVTIAGVRHAVVSGTNGVANDLGLPSGGYSGDYATGINDNGQVIGNASVPSNSPRAFIYSSNAFKILGPLPGGNNTRVDHGITSNGTTAVSGPSADIYSDGVTKIYHAYTIGSNGYGSPVDKGTYGNFYDINAADISEDGNIIVGNNDPGLFDGQGIVNTGSGFQLIDNLINPALDIRFQYASGVNDAGKIVGYGYNADGQTHPYLLTPVASPTYFISGKLWADNNQNGTIDSGEAVGGVRTVFIDANGNGKLDSGEKQTQSNAAGEYSFSGLANGTYKISRVFPAGYHLTNGTNGQPYVIVNINGASKVNINLGSAAGAAPAKASISGVLFGDSDKDGIFDAGEPVAANRVVFIDANGNGKLDSGEQSTTSDAQGKYLLGDLAAGTYKVTRVFPSGYKMSNNNSGYISVTVAASQAKTGINIGRQAGVRL